MLSGVSRLGVVVMVSSEERTKSLPPPKSSASWNEAPRALRMPPEPREGTAAQSPRRQNHQMGYMHMPHTFDATWSQEGLGRACTQIVWQGSSCDEFWSKVSTSSIPDLVVTQSFATALACLAREPTRLASHKNCSTRDAFDTPI